MMGILSYTTAQETVYTVLEASKPLKTSARPLSHYAASTTMWWLVPTPNELPAYRHGKFVFEPNWSGVEGMFIGLLIEKGYNPPKDATNDSPKLKRMRMDEAWDADWKAFLGDLAAGTVDSACAAMQEAVQRPALVRVFGFPLTDPNADPYDGDREVASFHYNEGTLQLARELSTSTANLIPRVEKATSLPALAAALAKLPIPRWTWICVYIGHVFTLQPDDPEAWTGRRLWDEYLTPVKKWFR